MQLPASSNANTLWPATDPETCERRGWTSWHGFATGMGIGALVGAFLINEAMQQDERQAPPVRASHPAALAAQATPPPAP